MSSITPEQIQWAAYYVSLQAQGQQLTPEQAAWASWYHQNYPQQAYGNQPQQQHYGGQPQQQAYNYGQPAPTAAPTAAAAKPLSPTEQAKANPAFARLKSLDTKKVFIKAYETAPQIQTKLRTVTKNPNFNFVYDLSNFGFPPHPEVEQTYRSSGFHYDDNFYKKELPNQVEEMKFRLLSWLADPEAQFLSPLVSGFQQFYNDQTNGECLNTVINTLEIRHAPQQDNTQSHWEVLGNKLSYVANCHSSEHFRGGKPIEPTAVWGTYHYVLERVAGLGAPPTQVVKMTPSGSDLD